MTHFNILRALLPDHHFRARMDCYFKRGRSFVQFDIDIPYSTIDIIRRDMAATQGQPTWTQIIPSYPSITNLQVQTRCGLGMFPSPLMATKSPIGCSDLSPITWGALLSEAIDNKDRGLGRSPEFIRISWMYETYMPRVDTEHREPPLHRQKEVIEICRRRDGSFGRVFVW